MDPISDVASPPLRPRHVPPELISTPSAVQIVGGLFQDIAGDCHYHVHHPQSGFPRPNFSDLVSIGAVYNSQERHPAPRCHPGTRREVLEKIDAWVDAGAESKDILWLHGPAGAGKSAIAQTVAETYAGRNQLAATFFFARTVSRRNSIRFLFPTIAIQIALSSPDKRQKLDGILKNDPYIAERAAGSTDHDLIASLYQKCPHPIPSSRSLVVIDGLDECQGHDDQCRILAQVSDMIHKHRLPLRFLIVSRPESHLLEAFEEPSLASLTEILSLYGDFQAWADVSIYLRSEFSRIYDSKRHRDIMESVPRPWPSDDTIWRLVRKSGGYFIYASTVVRFIDEEYFSPVNRLDQVLHCSTPSVSPPDSAPFAELDKLYIQILSCCPGSHIPLLRRILGYAVFDSVPRGIGHIAAFLCLLPGNVKLTLRGLRSLVSFEGMWEPLELMHASFRDFLVDEARAGTYFIDSDKWHHTQFCDSLSLGINSPHLLSYLTFRVSSPQLSLKGIGAWMCLGLQECFTYSSRKDELASFVQESLEESLWCSRFQDPDWSPDEDTLGLVNLFIGMIEILSPEDKVCLHFTLLDITHHSRFVTSAMQFLLLQPNFKLKSSS